MLQRRKLNIANYSIGIIVVVVSIFLGTQAKNVNQVLQLIVSALWGGYTAANVLKWYWWRFNSYGYFWGMLSGMLVSGLPMIFPNLLSSLFPNFAPDIRILYYFPVILIVSTIVSFVASYMTKPTDLDTLKKFYRNVKPWGFWGYIHEQVIKDDPEFLRNKNFKLDMFNVAVGTLWQTALVALPMFFVFHQFIATGIAFIIALFLSFILKKTWYDKLDNENILITEINIEEEKVTV